MKTHIIILTILFKLSLCRDYYVGMFKKNDILVAQDTVYKEKNYFGFTTAKYGRVFNCPITYFRVSDRLGVGRSPSVTVTRGGLQKKYITVLLTSSYNTPIAVNIYIGCENKLTTSTSTTKAAKGDNSKTKDGNKDDITTMPTTLSDDGDHGTDDGTTDGDGHDATDETEPTTDHDIEQDTTAEPEPTDEPET